ncbi:MAG: alpha/beta fold hydrolase [Pseudomonas sp.]
MVYLGNHGYQVIAHDRREHGRSSQARNGNEMNTCSDDLVALFEKLNLKDAINVGHSTGGVRWRRLVAGTVPRALRRRYYLPLYCKRQLTRTVCQ